MNKIKKCLKCNCIFNNAFFKRSFGGDRPKFLENIKKLVFQAEGLRKNSKSCDESMLNAALKRFVFHI